MKLNESIMLTYNSLKIRTAFAIIQSSGERERERGPKSTTVPLGEPVTLVQVGMAGQVQ